MSIFVISCSVTATAEWLLDGRHAEAERLTFKKKGRVQSLWYFCLNNGSNCKSVIKVVGV